MNIEHCRYGRKVRIDGDDGIYTINHDGPYDNGVTLRNDDGEYLVASLEELSLLEEDSLELEAEFERVYLEHHAKIQSKLKEAAKLICEAEALSEHHGIPFRPEHGLCDFRMSYIPDSLTKKFPGMDREVWQSLTGAYGGGDYSGWQASQTC